MRLFAPTIQEIQMDCDHLIVPYYFDTKHTRKGTALVSVICEKCGYRRHNLLYDPDEDDLEFDHIIKFTKFVDDILKKQGLKIDWDQQL